MDAGSIVSGLIASRSAEIQIAVAARLLRMNADTEGAVAQLLDAANRNASALANVAEGVGRMVDVRA